MTDQDISAEYCPVIEPGFFNDRDALTKQQTRALYAVSQRDILRATLAGKGVGFICGEGPWMTIAPQYRSVARFIGDTIIVASTDDDGAPFLLVQSVTDYCDDWTKHVEMVEQFRAQQ